MHTVTLHGEKVHVELHTLSLQIQMKVNGELDASYFSQVNNEVTFWSFYAFSHYKVQIIAFLQASLCHVVLIQQHKDIRRRLVIKQNENINGTLHKLYYRVHPDCQFMSLLL